MVKFEALNAEYGDCLLLHYELPGMNGDPAEKRLWLIDGGPTKTYEAVLRGRLAQLAEESEGKLVVRLGVVTHIDDDHIDGIAKLTDALVNEPEAEETPNVRFVDFWFNGFTETFGTGGAQGSAQQVATLASDEAFNASLADLAPDAAEDARAFLQGIPDGVKLMGNLIALKSAGGNPTLNGPFPDPQRLAKAVPKEITIDADHATVIVLAPTQAELDKLKTEWAKKTGNPAALQQVFSGKPDKSFANLSSIVMLATIQGKKILLTGDALALHIEDGWRAFTKKSVGTPLTPFPINIMKVPHHGADGNNSQELFELFPAEHYVFCANGKDKNPDMATLEGLFAARPNGSFTIHLTFEDENDKTAEQTAYLQEMAVASGGKVKLRFRQKNEISISIDL